MVRNDQIKKALISHIKSKSDVTAILGDATEVREYNWQGTDYDYPAVRLQLRGNNPDDSGCAKSIITFTWFCFDEETSSRMCDNLAGTLAEHYNKARFTSEGIRFFGCDVENIIPAIRQNVRTWRSEVQVRALVEG